MKRTNSECAEIHGGGMSWLHVMQTHNRNMIACHKSLFSSFILLPQIRNALLPFFLVILPPGHSSSVVLPYKTMWCILAKIWDNGATQIFADFLSSGRSADYLLFTPISRPSYNSSSSHSIALYLLLCCAPPPVTQ